MKSRAEATAKAVSDLLASGMQGQLQRDDTLGVWTFNQEVYTGLLALQRWSPEAEPMIASNIVAFLRLQNYDKQANFDKVLPLMSRVIEDSDVLTIILVSDGNVPLRGTAFDEQINRLYALWREEQQRTRQPILTVWRSERGRLTGCSVTPSPWPVELPPLPSRPSAAPPPVTPAPVPPARPPLTAVAAQSSPSNTLPQAALLSPPDRKAEPATSPKPVEPKTASVAVPPPAVTKPAEPAVPTNAVTVATTPPVAVPKAESAAMPAAPVTAPATSAVPTTTKPVSAPVVAPVATNPKPIVPLIADKPAPKAPPSPAETAVKPAPEVAKPAATLAPPPAAVAKPETAAATSAAPSRPAVPLVKSPTQTNSPAGVPAPATQRKNPERTSSPKMAAGAPPSQGATAPGLVNRASSAKEPARPIVSAKPATPPVRETVGTSSPVLGVRNGFWLPMLLLVVAGVGLAVLFLRKSRSAPRGSLITRSLDHGKK